MTPTDRIRHEKERADEKYGRFRSAHEGLGVLAEEVAELREAIQLNDLGGIIEEACQVSAVAWRLAESMRSRKTRRRSGV